MADEPRHDNAPIAEEPVENPEVHTPHARHGGLPRWLELAIAITALTTSVSSIVIALHHGRTMDRLVQANSKLVKANSIPYIVGGVSDVTPEGERVLSLDLANRGVGPALQRSLRVKVDGRYVTSVEELLAASLGPEQATAAEKILFIARNKRRTRFVGPAEQQMVFSTAKTPENTHYWELLEAAQSRWSIEYCYCSVFDECWYVASKWEEPKPIEECVRDEPHEFIP